MVNHSTNEFRPGLKLTIDGDPCNILESEFVKPGKGQAFTRIKIRNLKTGRVLEKTYKSGRERARGRRDGRGVAIPLQRWRDMVFHGHEQL